MLNKIFREFPSMVRLRVDEQEVKNLIAPLWSATKKRSHRKIRCICQSYHAGLQSGCPYSLPAAGGGVGWSHIPTGLTLPKGEAGESERTTVSYHRPISKLRY
jgi:hypothetical protein